MTLLITAHCWWRLLCPTFFVQIAPGGVFVFKQCGDAHGHAQSSRGRVAHFALVFCSRTGLHLPVPWCQIGPAPASRVRPGRGLLQALADRVGQPESRHLGGIWRGQDGVDQVHLGVLVLGHRQHFHMGTAADSGGQHHLGGLW